MAHFGLAALDFAGASLLEALGCAPVCLQFGHGFLLRKTVGTTSPSIRNSMVFRQYCGRAAVSGTRSGAIVRLATHQRKAKSLRLNHAEVPEYTLFFSS